MHQGPSTDCGYPTDDSSAEQGEFLTFPIRSPFGGLTCTPCSGDDDLIRTPGSRNDDFPLDFACPLIVDDDYLSSPYSDTTLFGDAGVFQPPTSPGKRAATPRPSAINIDNAYTVHTATPALDVVPSPYRPYSGSLRPSTPRMNAPLKRSRTEAFGDDDESRNDVAELGTTASRQSQNTPTARRSRRREFGRPSELETSLSERERQLKEQWRSRAMTLEAVLFSHGIPIPPATIYEPR